MTVLDFERDVPFLKGHRVRLAEKRLAFERSRGFSVRIDREPKANVVRTMRDGTIRMICDPCGLEYCQHKQIVDRFINAADAAGDK